MDKHPKHTARHPLPISNGYSSSGEGGIEVYCGRCDSVFRADEEWVPRYFAARRRKLDQDDRIGPGVRSDAHAELDAREADTLARIAKSHG